ncbi:MAG: hypothetical protein H6735_06530 [Alphaproteobacteria bacterium]|nr:hypothetical protein [Alphaproteobacteria bacterium]
MWLAAALVGCIVQTNDPGTPGAPGTIELSWTVGAAGCEAAGVADIEVQVGQQTQTFACAAGEATISAAPGRYDIDAIGLDADGAERYSGSTSVSVISDETSSAHVVLSALPAALRLTWFFENGRLCSANGVSDISATLFDDQDFLIDEQDVDCDAGELEFAELMPGTYAAVLVAHDGSGVPLFEGDATADLDKGDHLMVEVELFAH